MRRIRVVLAASGLLHCGGRSIDGFHECSRMPCDSYPCDGADWFDGPWFLLANGSDDFSVFEGLD